MASYTVRITDDAGRSAEYSLEQPVVSLGRSKKRDVTIDDISVSNHHGELRFGDDELHYVDLGSSNGSYHDGNPVPPQTEIELEQGDTVFLGKSRLEVLVLEQPVEATQMVDVAELRRLSGGHATVLGQPRFADTMQEAPAAAENATLEEPAALPIASEAIASEAIANEAIANEAIANEASAPAATPLDEAPPARASDDPNPATAAPEAPKAATDAAPLEAADRWFAKLFARVEAFEGPEHATRPEYADAREEPTVVEDESFGAAVPTLKGAVLASIDLVKGWKDSPGPTWPALQEALRGAGGQVAPHLRILFVPFAALAAFTAFFQLVAIFASGLSFLASIASLVAAVAGVLLWAAAVRYLLEVRIGRRPDLRALLEHTVKNDPKTLLISVLAAGVLSSVAAIALLLPGMLLGAFILPAYYVEGRRMVGLNQRSQELFLRDPKRVLLTALVLGAGLGVASTVVHTILGIIPFVGAILSLVFGVFWAGLTGPLYASFTVWMYLDVRHHFETGNAITEARDALPTVGQAEAATES